MLYAAYLAIHEWNLTTVRLTLLTCITRIDYYRKRYSEQKIELYLIKQKT